MRTTFVYLFLMMLAALFPACATTEVTAVWKDGSYQGKPHKVFVYAVLKKQTNRRIVEDEFVNRFKSRGVDAVPSYTIFAGDEPAKKEVLDETLKTQGFDTLLITQLTGSTKQEVQVPGMVTYQPTFQSGPYYRPWPGYYSGGYTAVYTPSYTVEEKHVMAETDLYDVATKKLIWMASTDTTVGGKSENTIKAYVAVIMKEMCKQKLAP